MRRELMTLREIELERRLYREMWLACLPWWRRWLARLFS